MLTSSRVYLKEENEGYSAELLRPGRSRRKFRVNVLINSPIGHNAREWHYKFNISELPGMAHEFPAPQDSKAMLRMPSPRARLTGPWYPDVVSKISKMPLEYEVIGHVKEYARMSESGMIDCAIKALSSKAAAASRKGVGLLMRGRESASKHAERYSRAVASFLRK